MIEKVKLAEVIQGIAAESFKAALATAKPKLKEISDEELAGLMGLSDYQYNHFLNKALGVAISKRIEEAIHQLLLEEKSLEVPHQFQVYVFESESRQNKNGNPAKKLSLRTRRALKEQLNQ